MGDRYRLGSLVSEVVRCTDKSVTLKMTDSHGEHERTVSRDRFDLMERNTFKLGADFEPAPDSEFQA